MGRIAVCYILAKNESRNIDGCLASLQRCGIRAIVLDSGSTDSTPDQVRAFSHAELRPYNYTNHCNAYNEITGWHSADEWIMVLDADMRVSPELVAEIEGEIEKPEPVPVWKAPIRMFWDGLPLRHSNLCPPKAIVFRAGTSYFEPVGHGERLKPETRIAFTKALLDHDDQKPFNLVLANQWRYALDVVRRGNAGHANFKDRLRRRTPLMMLITPLYAFFLKRGFLDGKAGIVYALDRLIAETLAFRASISPMVKRDIENERKTPKT